MFKSHFSIADLPSQKRTNIFDIDAIKVHQEPWPLLRDSFKDAKELEYKLKNYRKIMFARDPLERLWSGWVDKLYLGQSDSFGKDILVRSRHIESRDSMRCTVHDVGYSEFVNFVSHVSQPQVTVNQDPHFISQSKICQPCLIGYDYIGKLDTLLPDLQYLIEILGVAERVFLTDPGLANDKDNTLQTLHDIKQRAALVDTINSHTNRTFRDDFYRLRKLGCWSEKELLRRLWNSFIFRGFLPSTAFDDAHIRRYLSNQILNATSEFSMEKLEDVRKVVWDRFLHYSKLDDTVIFKERKKAWTTNTFADLPLEVQKKYMDVYGVDFEHFGYDKGYV